MFKSRLKNQPTEAERQAPSLKQRALRGSVWTFTGYGTSQAIRLGGNLVLTRLLFPEAFGLMALVQTFMIGLEMFSDVGIGPGIIQNKRGNDPAFLNTAWTLQVFRGLALWLCACLIAWPAAQFYGEPMLMQLLPVVGLTSLIAGWNSTKLATSNRQLMLGRLTLVELGTQVLSIMVTIIWAWMYQSVWALVGGGIIGTLVKMILSHIAFEGEQNRFHWEQGAFRELHRFGRWIFFSTALGFVVSQGDRLILARILDVRFLGVYTVALTLSLLPSEVIRQSAGRVLFPSYAELIRDHPERLYHTLRKSRLILLAMSWGASLIFIAFGEELISFLYDNRYADAGWMLQVLSIGTLGLVLSLSYDGIFLATGKTLTMAALLTIQICLKVTAMFLGAYWGGQHGVIIGLACFTWIYYPFDAICLARLSLWQPEIDLPLIALASVVGTILYFN